MVRRYVEQKRSDNNFNARNDDRSPQGALDWKGNSGGNGKDTSKDRKHGYRTQRPVLARRCVQLRARFKQKRKMRKEEDPFLLPKREDTRQETEKEIPKVAVFVRKAKQPTMLPRSEGAIPKDIRMRLLASTRVLTLQNPKVDAHGDTCVFKH